MNTYDIFRSRWTICDACIYDILNALWQKLVIQTKSVEYMPFTLSLASFLNGVCWTTYSFLPFDVNLFVRASLT